MTIEIKDYDYFLGDCSLRIGGYNKLKEAFEKKDDFTFEFNQQRILKINKSSENFATINLSEYISEKVKRGLDQGNQKITDQDTIIFENEKIKLKIVPISIRITVNTRENQKIESFTFNYDFFYELKQ